MRRGPDPWLTLLRWAAIVLEVGALYALAVRTTAWVTGRPPDWAASVGMLAMPLWLVPFVRWDERQRFGGRERWAEYRTALRTGALPAGADPDQWLPRLRARMDKVRGARRVVDVMSLVLFCFWGTLMFLGRMGWEGWPVGAALVLVLALMEVRVRWLVPRLHLLLAQLQPSAGESAG